MAGSRPQPHFTESQPRTQPSPGTQRSFFQLSDSYSLDVHGPRHRAEAASSASTTLWSLRTCGDNRNLLKSQQL